MASRIFALLIWAAVAASLAYWGLRWLARPTGVPANATPVSLDGGARGDMHRLLAGPAKAASGPAQDLSAGAALAGRLKLLGVVAPRQDGDGAGVALLSVDGKPPRAVRTGEVVDGDMVLKSLTQRGASIGPTDGPATVTLDLPLLPAATVGSLPPVSGYSTSDSAAQAASGTTRPGSAGAPGAPGAMSGTVNLEGAPRQPGGMSPRSLRAGRPG